MIEYITGKVAALNPAQAVLEAASGIGYMLNISLQTYTELEGKREARLLVHEVIREDAITLYGFVSSAEREMFRALIGVSGVGAATACVILSSMALSELKHIITVGDDARLKKVKGIGQKTAQRIIVDLRDKIKIDVAQGDEVVVAPQATEVYEEALAALLMLGFQKAPSQKALKKIIGDDQTVKVEVAIKKALTML